jgi:hypothetical protein
MNRPRTIAPVAVSLALAIAHCGEPGPTQYIAFESEFADFRAWPRVAVGSAALPGHPAGQRFVHRRPASASIMAPPPETDAATSADGGAAIARFAPGTILVKTVENGTPDTWDIFAMVKRGGTYNHNGAQGWEFFDLGITAEGRVYIRGRGVAPGSHAYGETAGVGISCNDCHGTASAALRDGVLSDAIAP